MRVILKRNALIFFAGLALAAQPVAAEKSPFSENDVFDGTCIVIFASALGNGSETPDPVKIRGLSSVISYFVGKLRGRNVDLKMSELITPAFAVRAVGADGDIRNRCSAEALQMGNDLVATGAILTAAGNATP